MLFQISLVSVKTYMFFISLKTFYGNKLTVAFVCRNFYVHVSLLFVNIIVPNYGHHTNDIVLTTTHIYTSYGLGHSFEQLPAQLALRFSGRSHYKDHIITARVNLVV